MHPIPHNFYYDAYRQGNSKAVWRYPTGEATPSGSYLVFNQAAGVMYYDCGRGFFNFTVNSAAPAGDSRTWGLYGSGGHLIFNIEGTVFSAQASWEGGVYSSTVEIPWDSAWSNTDTLFSIAWKAGQAIFYINDIARAVINSQAVPAGSMSPYVVNNQDDNLLIKNISGIGLQSLVLNPQITSADNTAVIILGEENMSVLESITSVASVPGQAPSDAMTLSEAVTMTGSSSNSVDETGSIADVVSSVVVS